MSDTLKQNRLLREQGVDGSFSNPSDERSSGSNVQTNVSTSPCQNRMYFLFIVYCLLFVCGILEINRSVLANHKVTVAKLLKPLAITCVCVCVGWLPYSCLYMHLC